MDKIPYNKPFLSITEQIQLLESRNVEITDQKSAECFLTFNNYYSVSGYIYYFEKKAQQRTHQFETPLSFNKLIALIQFDKELRELIFSSIQTIELSIRTSICRAMAKEGGPFCYEDPKLFKNFSEYSSFLSVVNSSLRQRKKEPFVSHFTRKYSQSFPPIWVMIEILTLGTISRLYENLGTAIQKEAAKELQTDHFLLVSWLKALTELRNVCAHHSRLWNRAFVNYPKIRKLDNTFPIITELKSHLGSFIPLFLHLLAIVDHKESWEEKSLALLKTNESIKPEDMGLREWWK